MAKSQGRRASARTDAGRRASSIASKDESDRTGGAGPPAATRLVVAVKTEDGRALALGAKSVLEYAARIDLFTPGPSDLATEAASTARASSPPKAAGRSGAVVVSTLRRFVIPGVRDGADSFVVNAPSLGRLEGMASLRIEAPDGTVLAQRPITSAEVAKGRFEVTAKPWAPSQPPEIPEHVLHPLLRVTGRVVDRTGRSTGAPRQVILYAAERTAGAKARPLAAVRTARDGYFSAELNRGPFEFAFAEISDARLEGSESLGNAARVDAGLDKDGLLPDRLLLVVDRFLPVDEADDDCGCAESPHGNPSMEELTSSDQFSSDLGGGRCVDLTRPNRSLEEFSYFQVVRTTEPAIAATTTVPLSKAEVDALVAEEQRLSLTMATWGRGEGLPAADRFAIERRWVEVKRLLADAVKAVHRATGRSHLSFGNAVDWDDDPTLYQATTVAHGHILHFKQVWRADGYSTGDLVSSIPLAPGQKKQIVVLDWQRRDETERSESLTSQEALAASLSRDRDVSEIVRSNLSESIKGGSKSKSSGFGFNLGVSGHGGGSNASGASGKATIPISGVPVSLGGSNGSAGMVGMAGVMGLGGGVGSSNSNAWQDASRSISATSLQSLRDRTLQSASAVRSQRSTVVQSATQEETVSLTTEVIANHNHCHALTILYFQCLRHLRVEHELADVQECLFVPFPMARFDLAKALRWAELLDGALLDFGLRDGFGALERISKSYRGYDYPLGAYDEEPLLDVHGSFQLTFGVPRPGDNATGGLVPEAWKDYMGLLRGGPTASDLFNSHFLGVPLALRHAVFLEKMFPDMQRRFVDAIRLEFVFSDGRTFQPADADFTLAGANRAGRSTTVTFRSQVTSNRRRKDITHVRLKLDPKITALPLGLQSTVADLTIHYASRFLSHPLVSGASSPDDLLPGDPVMIPTPSDANERRNPREEDRSRAALLLDHLNDNLEFYHQVIWSRLDPQRRFLLLDGFSVKKQRPNGTIVDLSLASVVENRIVGFAGNSVLFPVSRGMSLDPTLGQRDGTRVDLFDLYAPTTPIPPIRVSIPTPGVFAEAVMGSCNACEKKDESRFWRWGQEPIDEPTPILPVSTESRAQAPPDLTAKDFPTPIINIQNSPAAPEPVGLAKALEAVVKSDAFRDVTGLTLTQQNALAALQSALKSAEAAGAQSATVLTAQIGALQDLTKAGLVSAEKAQALGEAAIAGSLAPKSPLDKTLDSIENAKGKGLIDAGQANQFAGAAMSTATTPDSVAQSKPSLVDSVLGQGFGVPALFTAAGSGQAVSLHDGVRGLDIGTGASTTEPTPVADSFFATSFVQARQYRKGPRESAPDLVVIHTMEGSEHGTRAENAAHDFATTSVVKSAHYCVDNNSVVQCVKEGDIAFHANSRPVNARSIGVELAGFAAQTAADWADAYSTAMLALAVDLVADICRRYDIPATFVDAAGLTAGTSGISTHATVTEAYPPPKGGGHTDPGPNFPMNDFLAAVEERLQ